MLISFFKRILLLSSLAFTFCAWGELPNKLKATKDLGTTSLPTLNHWLKILDTLVKRPQNKMNKVKNIEYLETMLRDKSYRLPNQNLQNKS